MNWALLCKFFVHNRRGKRYLIGSIKADVFGFTAVMSILPYRPDIRCEEGRKPGEVDVYGQSCSRCGLEAGWSLE